MRDIQIDQCFIERERERERETTRHPIKCNVNQCIYIYLDKQIDHRGADRDHARRARVLETVGGDRR